MDYLKAYQQKLGLAPDGVIGKKTAAVMMNDLGITDVVYFINLMGQIAHESGLYKNARENLNYSEAGLLNIFRKYYANWPGLASRHARHPEMIGNYVYANRMGNGDEKSGDGFRYRGIFGLQLTGKTNIQDFIEYVGLPRNTDPDSLLNDPRNYFLAGKFWFERNGAAKLCTSVNSDCILNVSRKVNIGNTATKAIPNGFDDRLAQTKAIAKLVGVA